MQKKKTHTIIQINRFLLEQQKQKKKRNHKHKMKMEIENENRKIFRETALLEILFLNISTQKHIPTHTQTEREGEGEKEGENQKI